MIDKTEIHHLSNGLRVAVRHTPGVVSYIGVAINAGSRDEPSDKEGLAHFVEHTIFKGTLRRKAYQVANRMEAIGGELNAYTSKEETLVYTNAPAGYAERALELLADIISSSTFPAPEISKEREVVIEEINSYLDSPSDSVFDEFEELIYAGSSLAHNILGSPESVRMLGGQDCRDFLDSFYTPRNMALYISDPGDSRKLLLLAEKYFGKLNFPAISHRRTPPPGVSTFDITRNRDGHQSHTIIGAPLFGREDPRRFPLFLLNNYLAGPCMNSLLNRELREKRGLVYTVDSNVSLMSDAGLLLIYFGSDPSSCKKCKKIVYDTLSRLADHLLPARTFNAIREQYCGQLLVSTDNKESLAMSMGKSLLYFGTVHDPSTTAERVRAVTPEQFREVAELCIPDNCSSLTLQ